MRNFIVNDLVNEINQGRLELVNIETNNLLEKIDMYTTLVDIKYENKLRNMQLKNDIESYNDELKALIDKINNIEIEALKNKNGELMMRCEGRKAHLINIMMYLQEKYL